MAEWNNARRWRVTCAVVFMGFLVVVVTVGYVTPPRSSDSIRTDRLGPVSGESAEEYAVRAAAALNEAPEETAWALLTFDPPARSAEVIDATGDTRISRVVVDGGAGARPDDDEYRVLPDMPIDLPSPVPGVITSHEALETAVSSALSRLRTFRGAFEDGTPPDCTCVVGVVVRADGETLRSIAEHESVSTAEPLPGDAVWGRFAVRAR
ncbi:hypothetical protein [Hoyosella subflava]|uniref:Uncharacterized protein n=1 Tax=Hoyosella subflava (strain DSM 45089 / JCM 17490 / NBRC 109087 / DQS3-9A1) TaxID=443218 RepID=F6EG99_HOYSD|nr:hypothetical protein [Hoyosella subflava]AEF39824.1 hypothetical protein AS9A_1372 [Hoyosella subflava DQS3-9A1]